MPSGILSDHPLFVVLAVGLAVSLLALARLFVERSRLLRSIDRRNDRLLLFSTRMQAVTDFKSLFEALGAEIRETAGYRTAWLYLMREDDPDHTDLFSVSGDKDEVITDGYTTLTIKGDEFMEWLTTASKPTILEDARTDPRVNREIVEALGNRTIVHIPVEFHDRRLGQIGMGTFGDEGVRIPSDRDLKHLEAIARIVAPVLDRMRIIEMKDEVEDQLRQAQKMEAIGQLAGGIAHDFNNMLTGILGRTEFLLDDLPEGSRAREDVEAIRRSGKRAAQLTSQLLAYGRRQVVQPRVLALREVVGETVTMMRRVVEEDIVITTACDGGDCTVRMDHTQLEQILLNLCINARDAMPDGGDIGVELSRCTIDDAFVMEHPRARTGEFVRITVRDDGVGMDDETLSRVFEPFYTTKGPGRGTGLGMSMVQGIVDQNDGFIVIESMPGEGTTIRVYLPFIDAGIEVDVPASVPAARTGGTILVAEDDEEVLAVSREILESAGYRVLVASDGLEAGDVFAAHASDVDLLLFDVVMPGTNGLAAMRKILDGHPDVKGVLMSGYATDDLGTDFGDLEFPLVDKPFDRTSLLQAVGRALEGVRVRN